MAQQLDTSKGWCCDGRTLSEHAEDDDLVWGARCRLIVVTGKIKASGI